MPVKVRMSRFRLELESRVSITACAMPPGLFSGSRQRRCVPAGLLHRIGWLMSNLIVKSSRSNWMLV